MRSYEKAFADLRELVQLTIRGSVIPRGSLGNGNKFESRKACFKRIAGTVLRSLAKQLGGGKYTFIAGGSGVSGDAILNCDDGLTVWITPDLRDLGVMCRANQPGHREVNEWIEWKELTAFEALATFADQVRARRLSVPDPVPLGKQDRGFRVLKLVFDEIEVVHH